MKNNLNQAMQRARQYWFVDGLNEIAFGAVCLLLGLYFFAQAGLPAGSTLAELLSMSFMLLVLGGIFLASRLVNTVKSRLTYPRTGYVAYRKARGTQRLVLSGLAVLTSILLASLLAASPFALSRLPVVTGLLVGAVWVFLGVQIGLLRFFFLAAASLLIGGGVALAGFEDTPGLALYYALMGIAMFVSGGLTLRSYLRLSQSAGEQAE